MKVSGALVASIIAASSVAFSSSTHRDLIIPTSSNEASFVKDAGSSYTLRASSFSCEKEKFAPRFDGLRFIETLVTGHR